MKRRSQRRFSTVTIPNYPIRRLCSREATRYFRFELRTVDDVFEYDPRFFRIMS